MTWMRSAEIPRTWSDSASVSPASSLPVTTRWGGGSGARVGAEATSGAGEAATPAVATARGATGAASADSSRLIRPAPAPIVKATAKEAASHRA